MSSQKTEHYELNQWLATDQVLRTDFNADNEKIDAALAALDSGKAAAAAVVTLTEEVDMLTTTVASHTNQLVHMGSCVLYSTTYSGDGQLTRTHSFPHKPSLIFLSRSQTASDARLLLRGIPDNSPTVTWNDASVTLDGNSRVSIFNDYNTTYFLFAILEL